MKKVIVVVLTVIMLFCGMPAVLAASESYEILDVEIKDVSDHDWDDEINSQDAEAREDVDANISFIKYDLLEGVTVENVIWTGAGMIVLQQSEDDPKTLFRLDTGKVMMDDIEYVVSAGRYAVLVTTDGKWFRLDMEGNIIGAEKPEGILEKGLCKGYGLVYGTLRIPSAEEPEEPEEYMYVYNAELNRFSVHPGRHDPGDFWSFEVYRDPEENVYYLTTYPVYTSPFGIYRADGTAILETDRYYLNLNTNRSFVTNGYIAVTDKETGLALTLSAYTGEVIARFETGWEETDLHSTYIYEDNTATTGHVTIDENHHFEITGPLEIVGLDGTIMKTQSEEDYRFWRLSSMDLYSYVTKSGDAYYVVQTDRTFVFDEEESEYNQTIYICKETGFHYLYDEDYDEEGVTCLETGEVFNSFLEIDEPDPERAGKYPLISSQFCTWIYDENERGYGIISPEGELLGNQYWPELPDQQTFMGDLFITSSWYPFREDNGLCIVVDKNYLTGVINEAGEMVLEAAYDDIQFSIGTFDETGKNSAFCIVACKYDIDSSYVFNEQGELLFSIPMK